MAFGAASPTSVEAVFAGLGGFLSAAPSSDLACDIENYGIPSFPCDSAAEDVSADGC
jgi:hypothetical protein